MQNPAARRPRARANTARATGVPAADSTQNSCYGRRSRARSTFREKQRSLGQNLDHGMAEASRRHAPLMYRNAEPRSANSVGIRRGATTAPFQQHLAITDETEARERNAHRHRAGAALKLVRNARGRQVIAEEARKHTEPTRPFGTGVVQHAV